MSLLMANLIRGAMFVKSHISASYCKIAITRALYIHVHEGSLTFFKGLYLLIMAPRAREAESANKSTAESEFPVLLKSIT